MRRTVIVLCLALVASACGGNESAGTTTTTTPPAPSTTRRTTTTTTSTTTTLTGTTSPLTGLPVADAAVLDRRAIVVKVDNHPNARPQSGLPNADMVLELPVEGISRLVGIFHTQDVTDAGPIRSIRPTDWQVAALFGGPLVVSGGQDWVVARNRDNGADIIGEVGRPQTHRSSARRAPHNLYGDTEALRTLADQRGYPDDPPRPIWEFGELPAGAPAATDIRLRFSGSLVADWHWNGTVYERTTNGAPHEWIDREGERSQVTADVLVVLSMETYLADPPPGGGAARAVESIGSGEAWVFADGAVVSGRWERRSKDDGFTLTTDDGDPMLVPPGMPWVSFFPSDAEPDWS